MDADSYLLNIDDCASTPCLNGADCTDGLNEYSCTCASGFVGTHCETNVDDCDPDPCKNGGTCIDGVDSFTCECASGFAGETCEARYNVEPR
ncbi:uncharacterized protein LOC144918505 [Branchiostoma floridae x Branchiostoma belcheri]